MRQLIEEGIPETKVRLIYNGIDVSRALPDRAEARRALGINDNTLVGVVVANLIHYKGHREVGQGALASRAGASGRLAHLGRRARSRYQGRTRGAGGSARD